MKTQNGFTLIELVMVIVILGVLSAVAVPNFIDMRTQARQAAVDAAAGTITSASAINYAGELAESADAKTTSGLSCSEAALTLTNSLDNVTLSTTVNVGTTEGDPTECTVTGEDSLTATAYIISVTN